MSFVILRTLSKGHNFKKLLGAISSAHYTNRSSSNNIIHSALPPVEVPDLPIHEFVFENFHRFPHKTAVECGLTGKKFTYEDIHVKSLNLGTALRKKLKLGKGDVIALILPNVPEYPICVLGALQAAVVVTTINPLYTPEEINTQLQDSGAKAIITLGALWPLAQASISLSSTKIPVLAIKMQEAESLPAGCIDFREFTDAKMDSEGIDPVDQNDVAILPYSSGTTGLPKGVELTSRNIVANLSQLNEKYLRLAEDTTDTHQDVVPAILPFFHIYGITVIMLTHLYHMCKLVTLPKFTPESYISLLVKHNPHVLFVVPPIVLFMCNHPAVKTEYLKSVRSIVSGAAPLGASDEERIQQKAAKEINVLQAYGLTETSPGILVMSPIRKKELKVTGSTGEAFSNTSLKVVPVDNVNGEPLGPNEPGELLVKGPQVMKRYHNRPQETREAFVDGWFRTGDVVHYDKNNMFYVTDRMKELIKVKGFQVAPAELEEIIRNHPDVSDAAVIGIPHSEDGEVPRAYIVPRPSAKLDTKKLQDFVNEKVAKYKQLRGGVEVVESIPKNPSGKIMRRQLRLQYEKEQKSN